MTPDQQKIKELESKVAVLQKKNNQQSKDIKKLIDTINVFLKDSGLEKLKTK